MSYLRDYLAFSRDNEAPEMYHVWAGLSVLAASMGRRVWLPWTSNMFPHFYTTLVGDPGNGKSTAIWFAKLLSGHVGIKHAADVETVQSLNAYMAGLRQDDKGKWVQGESPVKEVLEFPDGTSRITHPMFIIAGELVSFISYDKEGWITFLTNIWDENKYYVRTKNAGTTDIDGPSITVLGGLTTEMTKRMQVDHILHSGYSRRALYQWGKRSRDRLYPHRPEVDMELLRKCKEHIFRARMLRGEIKWAPDAYDWWIEFYNDYYRNRIDTLITPNTKAWYETRTDYVLKIGILMMLGERADKILTIGDLEAALGYISRCEQTLHLIFGGHGRNELAGVAASMLSWLTERQEPISSKTLYLQFFKDFKDEKDFPRCIQFLKDSNKIVSSVEGSLEVIAIPEVMKRRARLLAGTAPTVPPPPSVTPPALPPGVAPVTRPSIVPAVIPGMTAVPPAPNGVEPQNGTGASPTRPAVAGPNET